MNTQTTSNQPTVIYRYLVVAPGEDASEYPPMTLSNALEYLMSTNIGDIVRSDYNEVKEGRFNEEEFNDFRWMYAFPIAESEGYVIHEIKITETHDA